MAPTIITKPKVSIDKALLKQLNEQVHEAGQVVVHCLFENTSAWETWIRIWPTTFLFAANSNHRSNLITFENISPAPSWKIIPGKTTCNFTLVFSGLPKSCTHFDLIEQIPLPDPFILTNISRNDSDVYFVNID